MSDHAPGVSASILMVDDNATNLFALGEILGTLGHELVPARSGAEALRLVGSRSFAVILMDAQMPGLDGFQTVRAIKQLPSSRYVPVIFLTAFDHQGLHEAQGYEHGAVDYLIKPIDPQILRSKVGVFVELHIQRELNRRHGERLHAEHVARVEAEARIHAREDVIAIVSHEMGSPISAMALQTRLLLNHGRATSDETVVEYALRQQAAVDRLGRMVHDLLDASMIESGRFTVEKKDCPLEDVVDSVVRELATVASTRSQNISASLPPGISVKCDRDRIAQVVANLVGNALKFGGEGASVGVEGRSTVREVIVAVRDTGPGIASADLPRIFDRYWRAQGKNRLGLGLGLAISRGIVQAHGGRIWAESAMGEGSTFYFALPR